MVKRLVNAYMCHFCETIYSSKLKAMKCESECGQREINEEQMKKTIKNKYKDLLLK